MKNKVLLICCFLFFSFCFVILFKSLNNFNAYKPETIKNEKLASFVAKDFFSGEEISSDKIFVDSDYYILNIWSSWCGPCRDEHPILMEISKNISHQIINVLRMKNGDSIEVFNGKGLSGVAQINVITDIVSSEIISAIMLIFSI